jgi:hypothetical protein
MLFGDRSDFAIEADVGPSSDVAGVWGRMCVWCAATALGNIDEASCALYPAYIALRSLASNLDSLWSKDFSAMDDAAIWAFLDSVLYGDQSGEVWGDGRTTRDRHRHSQQWDRFDFLTNWGEQFDGWKAFIVCHPGGSVRVLSRQHPENVLRCVDVSRAGVIAAIKDFSRWFEEAARARQPDADATGVA